MFVFLLKFLFLLNCKFILTLADEDEIDEVPSNSVKLKVNIIFQFYN